MLVEGKTYYILKKKNIPEQVQVITNFTAFNRTALDLQPFTLRTDDILLRNENTNTKMKTTQLMHKMSTRGHHHLKLERGQSSFLRRALASVTKMQVHAVLLNRNPSIMEWEILWGSPHKVLLYFTQAFKILFDQTSSQSCKSSLFFHQWRNN